MGGEVGGCTSSLMDCSQQSKILMVTVIRTALSKFKQVFQIQRDFLFEIEILELIFPRKFKLDKTYLERKEQR
jgi:hypothetical protein